MGPAKTVEIERGIFALLILLKENSGLKAPKLIVDNEGRLSVILSRKAFALVLTCESIFANRS